MFSFCPSGLLAHQVRVGQHKVSGLLCELRAEKAIFCLHVELVAQGWHNKPELLHEERHLPAAAKLRQRFVAAKSLL